jgi:hypothetical protein
VESVANELNRPSPGTLGCSAEMLVCSDLMNKGYQVYWSLSPNADCDLIAFDPTSQQYTRIEVKSGQVTPNGLISCVFPPMRDYGVKFDLVAVVALPSGPIYYTHTNERIYHGSTES